MTKKTIKIDKDTHHQLDVFRVAYHLKTFDDAIRMLLKKKDR